jgi:hypothetical protein
VKKVDDGAMRTAMKIKMNMQALAFAASILTLCAALPAHAQTLERLAGVADRALDTPTDTAFEQALAKQAKAAGPPAPSDQGK